MAIFVDPTGATLEAMTMLEVAKRLGVTVEDLGRQYGIPGETGQLAGMTLGEVAMLDPRVQMAMRGVAGPPPNFEAIKESIYTRGIVARLDHPPASATKEAATQSEPSIAGKIVNLFSESPKGLPQGTITDDPSGMAPAKPRIISDEEQAAFDSLVRRERIFAYASMVGLFAGGLLVASPKRRKIGALVTVASGATGYVFRAGMDNAVGKGSTMGRVLFLPLAFVAGVAVGRYATKHAKST